MDIGKVYLIGGGPGSADLVTVRGYQALLRADVIIYDAILPKDYLEELGIPTHRKVIEWLGAGSPRKDQARINQDLRDWALKGKCVARLKNGDPFVFGRGNEEAAYLSADGVPWEVIPGLSACTGGPTIAGIPVTRRGAARSFAAVTAREAGGTLNETFPKADTLVIFMGVSVLDNVVATLRRDGWPEDTPSAVLERVSQPWERRIAGPLSEIAGLAEKNSIASPAILIVGAEALSHEGKSLRPRILYTGLDPANFRTLGDILHWPGLTAVLNGPGYLATPGAIMNLQSKRYDWIVFTSKLGVRSFFRVLLEDGHDARLLGETRIIAAGAGTALLLSHHGITADAAPVEGGSRGILNELGNIHSSRGLLVQGSHAPKGLEEALRDRGASVDRLALHRVVPNPELGRPLPSHDIIYFTSPSGVRAYWETYRKEAFRKEVWCIGDVTRDAIKALGFVGRTVDPHQPRPVEGEKS